MTADGTYVVRARVSDEQLSAGVGRAWAALALLGLLLIIAALVIADRLARRISTPVTALADVALRLRDGELDMRAVPSGPPETVELAEAFNQLADRINELLVAERAAVGDLCTGCARRSPLFDWMPRGWWIPRWRSGFRSTSPISSAPWTPSSAMPDDRYGTRSAWVATPGPSSPTGWRSGPRWPKTRGGRCGCG